MVTALRYKKLQVILTKHSGRNISGKVTVRHQGGRHKRYYRIIDWKRDKDGIPAVVESLEYDPNRSTQIALVRYIDGERRYILAPVNLAVGQKIMSGDTSEVQIGNSMRLGQIPVGSLVHNIELFPGKGAQFIRSAGSAALVIASDGKTTQLKLPSGEIRIFKVSCRATIGQLGNVDLKNQSTDKAGRSRHRGIRPAVRGVAQNPRSHPHGGGEGRSGIGLPSPKSPWGKPTLGVRTRKRKKYSDKYIVERRK